MLLQESWTDLHIILPPEQFLLWESWQAWIIFHICNGIWGLGINIIIKTMIQLTTLTLYQPSSHQPSPHCRWLKEDIFRNWAVPVCERVTPVREQASSSQCPFANWFNWASRSQMVFKYSSHSQMGTHNCARIRTVAKKTWTVREHALFLFRSNTIGPRM